MTRFFVSALMVTLSSVASGGPRNASPEGLQSHVDDYLDFLASANEFSPLEGAGSHGSIGIGLGLGASTHQVPEHRDVIDDQLRNPDDVSGNTPNSRTTQVTVPRLFIHKGLPIPIDVGISVGQITSTNATTAGGYAQWTVFEGFALPAFAVRAKYSRLMGLPSTEYSTVSGEAVASYGLFRIFNIYGSYGRSQSVSSIQTGGASGTSLALSEEPGATIHATRHTQSRALGLQFQIVPQFFILTAEHKSVAEVKSWIAKVSVGI